MNSAGNDPSAESAPDGGPTQRLAAPATFRSLRVWPALLLVALMILTRYGPAHLEGGLSSYWMIAVFGPVLCSLLLVIWWLAASRATWKERLFGFLGLIASLAVTVMLSDPTMRGPGTINLTAPMGMMAFALGATVLRKHRPTMRTGVPLMIALVSFGFSLLFRGEGMTGDYALSLRWRWSQTPEALMLASRKPEAAAPVQSPESDRLAAALSNPGWPGFRGADRAGCSRGPQISTNWIAHPPRQLWKIPVGPAWSSFAFADRRLFTQEQRGPKETVVCYDADTGRELWSQALETRFDEPLGGPGPRATPTLADGGLFVTGATGNFLRLNPVTGALVWKQNLKEVSGREVPMWGFAASPLVARSTVIVHAGGPGGKGLLGFDFATGTLRWSAADGNDSYSSPQLSAIAGEELVLMLTNEGLLMVDPATGKERLNYEWKFGNYRALQPSVVDGNTILLPTGMSVGTRAIRVSQTNGQFAAVELWTSRHLKPDFTDLVTYNGCVYGIDGGIFTCVDIKTGLRRWKGGRYGKGQVLLLESSGLLLVAAEDGRVVLLRADSNEHAEVDSFKALEGKTWNHPVVVGDRLYLRNSQEAACFQLPMAETKKSGI
ncbi:MAG: PQQ-like beta-propeller repeat protein [Verrucomicrobia bacterium]|nr:PQQ-like beta-propeller repeat protein [Verrucomicrobiota bacterium]